MKRITLIATGKVQEVFYRNHCKQAAQKLGVSGYAKNLPDKTVMIIAEGEDEALKAFSKECLKGPLMGFVENLDSEESEATGEFEGFDIR